MIVDSYIATVLQYITVRRKTTKETNESKSKLNIAKRKKPTQRGRSTCI